MRIVSQDGRFDLPYECFVVGIYAANDTSIIAYTVNSDDDAFLDLAEYSTKEKAVKAMEMLRTEYEKFQETKSINGGYFALDYPKVFRFPQDSEV